MEQQQQKERGAPHLSKQLHVDLGDAVDGGGPHDGQIRGVLAWGGGPKGTNGARAKHAQIVDLGWR